MRLFVVLILCLVVSTLAAPQFGFSPYGGGFSGSSANAAASSQSFNGGFGGFGGSGSFAQAGAQSYSGGVGGGHRPHRPFFG